MRTATILAAVAAAVLLASCARADPVDLYSWNEDTGELMTLYSYAMYCKNATLSDWSCKWCSYNDHIAALDVIGFAHDNSKELLGMVGVNHHDQQIIVGFRGTNPTKLHNILLDANLLTVTPYDDVPEVRVHKGFWKGYTNLRPQILAMLQPVADKYPSYPIVVTGHSLGGALASLCAMDIARDGAAHRMVMWDLGTPRVGNTAFANYFSALVPTRFRMVWERDIIPQHPSQGFGKGWTHPPQEIWHYKKSWRQCSLYDGEDPACQDSLWSITTVSVVDHLRYFGLHWTLRC